MNAGTTRFPDRCRAALLYFNALSAFIASGLLAGQAVAHGYDGPLGLVASSFPIVAGPFLLLGGLTWWPHVKTPLQCSVLLGGAVGVGACGSFSWVMTLLSWGEPLAVFWLLGWGYYAWLALLGTAALLLVVALAGRYSRRRTSHG